MVLTMLIVGRRRKHKVYSHPVNVNPLTFNLPDKHCYPHPLRNIDVAMAMG